MMAKYNFHTRKNFAVVWRRRRLRRLGKCLKNYEKCVAKKIESKVFGQEGESHENGVWHENVKNKKRKMESKNVIKKSEKK